MIRLFISRFFNSNKKSSYDIERQFSQFKLNKAIEVEKSFKAYNLKPPEKAVSQYQSPQKLLADISNIKQYSHKYPHFLMKELQDRKSKIAAFMGSTITQLFMMKTEDGVELLLFLDSWNFINEEERKMAGRWISNQTLNLQQMWNLLKSKLQIWDLMQNMILKHLQTIEVRQYSFLFKILNYYRLNEFGSETFFQTVQKHIVRNIQKMNGSQLVELVSHYSNNPSQNIQSKLNILDAVANRMKIILKHLSAAELITILYCYLKMDLFKEEMADEIMRVIIQTLPRWKETQIKQLLEISTNMGSKQQPIIMELMKLFYKNKLSPKLYPSLYSLAIEYSIIDQQFIRRMEEKLLEQIHNMTPQNISKSCWAFAVVPRHQTPQTPTSKIQSYKLFFRKIEDIIQGGLRDYTIKDATRIVWSLGVKQFKLDAPFWNNIELWIQEQLSKETATVRDVSLVIWAYTNQITLRNDTISIIKDIIFRKLEECEGFDLAMICWFFSQIKQENRQLLIRVYKKFGEIIESMQLLEMMKCLRWFLSQMEVQNQILTKFVRRVVLQYHEKSYYTLLNILMILTSIKIEDRNLLIDAVVKVDQQIKILKQIQSAM